MTSGDCFFTPETATVSRHLWIIVSDPTGGRVVIANFSTVAGPDNPMPGDCQVAPKEHPAISRPSFVRCEEARIADGERLTRLLAVRTLAPTKPAPAELLEKVRRALAASRHTPLEVKELLRTQGLIA